MNIYLASWLRRLKAMSIHILYRRWPVKTSMLAICIIVLLSACTGLGGASAPAATPTPVRVNGFGTAANHTHSLIAYPDDTLVLATHYGLFRSSDGGKTWQLVAGGPGQLMQDLMTFSLVSSPLNEQRMYVLTQRVYTETKGTLGLYTSVDKGRTWKLAITTAELGDAFLVQPGNDTPDEVYVYLNKLGALGLKVSLDGGAHFSATGTLPFGNIRGMLAVPGAPGHLLVYGNDGLASSTDGGVHWQVMSGIEGAIFEAITAGKNLPIYASGDTGIYASQDGGKSFTLVNAKTSYNALTASSTDPQVLYGKTGTSIFHSADGGHTWNTLPDIRRNFQSLAVSPKNAAIVYLALNYPTEIFRYDQGNTSWTPLTPQA